VKVVNVRQQPDLAGSTDTETDQFSCARCSRAMPVDALTWSRQSDRRGTFWLCDTCTRESIGSIEAGIDDIW
jgi:hypothetical protein